MKKRYFIVSISILIAASFLFLGTATDADASSNQEFNETLSTQESWYPAGFISATVTYEIDAQMSPSQGSPGDATNWEISLANGQLTLDGTVEIGSINESFSKTFDVPLGTSQEIEVPNTMGQVIVTVNVSAEVKNIEVSSGPGQAGVSELYFHDEGSNNFEITISEDAAVGESIEVSNVKVVPTIEMGLEEEVPLVGPGQIAETTIGAPEFEPTMSASAIVVEEGAGSNGGGNGFSVFLNVLNLGNNTALYISIFLILAAIAVSFLGKRSGKNTKEHFRQAIFAAIGTGICLVSLFHAWISIAGVNYTAFEVGSLLYQISEVAISQAAFYFLLFFVMIMYFGVFLHGYGYDAGRGLISKGSIFFILVTVLLILGLGAIPRTQYRYAPWVAIFGGVVSRVSLNIARGERWEESYEVNVCPSCEEKVEPGEKYCTNCGEKLKP